MTNFYDVIVIGAGTAGATAARKCASEGLTVAIVDALRYGGTCALRGCDPKKLLRRGAEVIDAVQLMSGNGIKADGLTIDWRELVAFMRNFIEAMPERIESGLTRTGIKTLHGAARFIDETSLVVDGELCRGSQFLIATGSHPRPLDEPGAEHLIDSTDFMDLDELPRRLVFVGGGHISFEFAHMAARAGSDVTIITRGDRPLKGFDEDLVDRLVARSAEIGIKLIPHAPLVSIEQHGTRFVVISEKNGMRHTYEADLCVHGAGRVPAIYELGLDSAGVDFSRDGITVDRALRSISNPSVYAAGDAANTPAPPLTPVAAIEGDTAAANMVGNQIATPDYSGVPSVLFTLPPLARVGMLESEAREADLDVDVHFHDTGDWYSNVRVGQRTAGAKIIVERSSRKVIGAHLLGPGYDELINMFGLAIKLGLTVPQLTSLHAAYPTVGSDLDSML